MATSSLGMAPVLVAPLGSSAMLCPSAAAQSRSLSVHSTHPAHRWPAGPLLLRGGGCTLMFLWTA